MKTLEDYKAIAEKMAYGNASINLGIDRKVVVKMSGDVATILIYCYTMNGRYKGCYKCGSYNTKTGKYSKGYDVNLETGECR